MATDADDDADAWYEGEPSFGRAMVVELQRLARRARARPILTTVLALFMTGLVVVRVIRKPTNKIASVIIAVNEGNLASGRDPMPVEELEAYVNNVLLHADESTTWIDNFDVSPLVGHVSPVGVAAGVALETLRGDKVDRLIDRLGLFPLRRKFGRIYGRGELGDMVEITVYRNFFLAETYDPDVRRNARVEVTATYPDADIAMEVAKGVADILVENSDARVEANGRALAQAAGGVLDSARADAEALDRAVVAKRVELATAQGRGDAGRIAAIGSELRGLEQQAHDAQQQLAIIESGALADRSVADAMAAGLDLKFDEVSERRPRPDVGRQLRLAIVAIVVLVIMIPTAIIFVGAFDPRVHDAGDVTRLGYASLGHLPPYTGDRIGSLRARGVRRPRAAEY